MTTDSLIAFFGWCFLINLGLLIFSMLVMMLCRGRALHLYGKIFWLTEEEVGSIYLRCLAYYKIVIIAFNLVPYLALRVIA